MHLDMPTISAVSISVTAILGFVLIFTWSRERASPLIGWWGLAQLVMSIGIVIAVVGSLQNSGGLTTAGQACMILASALAWMAVRQFEGRTLRFSTPQVGWILAWPAAFLAAHAAGVLQTFDERLILACAMLATLNFLAAFELSRDWSEPLTSRWPAVVLLIATGAGYLTWLPLTLTMPIREAGLVFASSWFPAVILIATLGRIALAFIVLALVKERQELKQRIDALTDPLTGLPNRRALFEAADLLGRHSKYLKGDPISVLVFDLDHFKKINDTFGHRLGDRVLQVFAETLTKRLETGSIVGRLGGEEFAAILPGADLTSAALTAEAVRAAFAQTAAVIDGTAVACTVSVGAASHDDIDCDLGALFHRADGALYTAKSCGRNRVEIIGPADVLADRSVAHLPGRLEGQPTPRETARATRRFRRGGPYPSNPTRPRRGGPPLS
jgi:diguanylate cyclase (GGDEF)-like protein